MNRFTEVDAKREPTDEEIAAVRWANIEEKSCPFCENEIKLNSRVQMFFCTVCTFKIGKEKAFDMIEHIQRNNGRF